MTREESDWVDHLFAAGTRDWTPAAARDVAHVLFAPASSDPETTRRCASVLSDAERERADRFVTDDGKAHFLQRRAFRRYCGSRALGSPKPLSQVVFQETGKGRPHLPDAPALWFSFSACRFGFVGAWSSTRAVGVDIEDRTRRLEPVPLARRYFSKTEADAIEGLSGQARRQAFFHLWSLKEAAMKSVGEGLPIGLDAFEFELAPNVRVVHTPSGHGGPERFGAHVIEGTDYCAALVTAKRRLT